MVVKDEKYNEFGLKEYDPVLVKNRSMNTNDCRNVWTPAVFGCIIKMPMGIMYQANSLLWEDCIPYTKQTAHLIGTDQTFDKNLIKKKRSKKKNSK